MKKIAGWEKSLGEFFMSSLKNSFKWGEQDCCLFASDAIKAITGIDTAQWFRGKYKTRDEAFRLLKKFSGGPVAESVEKIARESGLREVSVDFLTPSDVVLMKIEPLDKIAWQLSAMKTVGVRSFAEGIFSPGKEGLVLSTQPEIYKAWRV